MLVVSETVLVLVLDRKSIDIQSRSWSKIGSVFCVLSSTSTAMLSTSPRKHRGESAHLTRALKL